MTGPTNYQPPTPPPPASGSPKQVSPKVITATMAAPASVLALALLARTGLVPSPGPAEVIDAVEILIGMALTALATFAAGYAIPDPRRR